MRVWHWVADSGGLRQKVVLSIGGGGGGEEEEVEEVVVVMEAEFIWLIG
jgi:hypothetical protein